MIEEKTLKDLLERVYLALSKTDITYNQLINEKFKKNLIEKACKGKLIDAENDPYYKINYPTKVTLTKSGFLMLSQMRTKKSMDKLDESISDFNKSSTTHSKAMYGLNISIWILTIVMVVLMAIQVGIV